MSAASMVRPPDDALLTERELDFLASLDAQDYPQTPAQEDKARRDRAAARGIAAKHGRGCDHEWRAHDDHRPDHPDWRPAYLCAEGIERDRAWFERHHGRNHYFRSPIGGEAASLEGGPPGWLPIIVVRQVEPGARIRAACWVQGVH